MQIISENVLIDEANMQSGEIAGEGLAPKPDEKSAIEFEEEDQPIKIHSNDRENVMSHADLDHHNQTPSGFELEAQADICDYYEV